jgi:sulfur relay (sulfurtransferase) complex TusBCD TusD component (DsrE family)
MEVTCTSEKLHIEKLEQNAAVHNHNMRQKLNLHVQVCRTNALKKGVMNRGIKLYSHLPNIIREAEKIMQFKRAEMLPIKTYILLCR